MMAGRADRVEGRKRIVAVLNTWSRKPTTRTAMQNARPRSAFASAAVMCWTRAHGRRCRCVVCLHGDLGTTMLPRRRHQSGRLRAARLEDPWRQAQRDTLEAELDGAGANCRCSISVVAHSFAEEGP